MALTSGKGISLAYIKRAAVESTRPSQATGFVSNDPAFCKVPGLEVVILDDLS